MHLIYKYPFVFLGSVVTLYLWFRTAMWYLRNKHLIREKAGIGLTLLEIGLAPGYILDVLFNWTFGLAIGIVFVPTLSEKLCYIRNHPDYGFNWIHRFADWACDEVLNPWAIDHKHC